MLWIHTGRDMGNRTEAGPEAFFARRSTAAMASANQGGTERVPSEPLRPIGPTPIEALQELFWPTRCVNCDMPGELLCDQCRKSLPWIDQRYACPVCGAPFGTITCTQCKKDWACRSCVCAMPFAGVAARLATCLKDAHELRLAPVIAAAIATALDEASGWPAVDGGPRFDANALDVLCFVPATEDAYRRRGFDHMELVTRELSWLVSLPLADVLVREQGKDQRTLGREERAQNLRGTIEVLGDVRGADLLLVDDVITTGASVGACTEALLERGAASVTACALARVW